MIANRLQAALPAIDQLEFLNVSMRFSKHYLFTGISGTVSAGDCLAIIGPNGSGKSTLIKILAKLLRQSAGEISITHGGSKVKDAAYQSAIGVIAPYLDYYDMLTGLENLALFSKLRGVEYSDTKAMNVMDGVNLKYAADRRVHTYSTGMKQRLKWAVVSMIDPPVWLLDEPFTFLDDDGCTQLYQVLTEVMNRRKVIILATNSAEEAKIAQAVLALGKSDNPIIC